MLAILIPENQEVKVCIAESKVGVGYSSLLLSLEQHTRATLYIGGSVVVVVMQLLGRYTHENFFDLLQFVT